LTRKNKDAVILEHVTIQRNGRDILHDISWNVETGTSCAVIGPNGAGKSTLIAVISGYLWPREGHVTVLGNRYGRVDISRVRKRIGIVAPSRIPSIPPWMTVREVVASGFFGTIVIPPREGISPSRKRRIEEKISVVGMDEMANKRFLEISTGEKMRALLCRAMIAEHELLLLDEPTAGLDLSARVAVIKSLEKTLREKNPPTLVIVSHHLEELPKCIRDVLLLREGRMISGGTAKEVLTSENLSRTYGCRVAVHCEQERYYTRVKNEEWEI